MIAIILTVDMVTYMQCLNFLFQLDDMVLWLQSTLLHENITTHSATTTVLFAKKAKPNDQHLHSFNS